jgi:hypothetical protein
MFRNAAALIITTLTVVMGAVLAVFAAATVAVLAVIASAVLGLAALTARARRRRATAHADAGVIEARHLGGHHWVAYGWNERR